MQFTFTTEPLDGGRIKVVGQGVADGETAVAVITPSTVVVEGSPEDFEDVRTTDAIREAAQLWDLGPVIITPRRPFGSAWRVTQEAPVTFDVRTEWLYGTDDSCICCVGKHAHYRGGRVVRSDVPTKYEHLDDLASHLFRAVESFGDGADLEVIVRRRETKG